MRGLRDWEVGGETGARQCFDLAVTEIAKQKESSVRLMRLLRESQPEPAASGDLIGRLDAISLLPESAWTAAEAWTVAETCREAIAAINRASADVARLREEREALKREARVHAQEARTQRSTVHEIYQAISGATGEPASWHGAAPVVAFVAESRAALADVARLTLENEKLNAGMAGATYCAYCGYRVELDDMAASGISEHIHTCPQHPMRAVEAERDTALAALAAAVAEEREACRNATCPYCATGFPIVSDSDGSEIGHRLGDDPAVPQVTRPCKARPIRARAAKEAT